MSRTITWSVEFSSIQDATASGSFEVDDDATAEDIQAMVDDEVGNYVSWGWSEESGPGT